MKILYIANSRIPTEKAHGLQIMKTIEAMLGGGTEVTLIIPRRRNFITDSVKDYYGLERMPEIEYIGNYFWFLERFSPHLYFIAQRISFGIIVFLKVLRSGKNIIYSREITISYFLTLFGKKAVFEDHEPKKRFVFLYRMFVRKIWRKVIVAEHLKDIYSLYKVKEDSFIVVPNGVDLNEFENARLDRIVWKKFNLNPEEKIVLYVGHLYRWKGVYTLIDSAQFIKEAKVVLIGGTEEDRKRAEKYVFEKEIKNVLIHPFVPHKEAIVFMKSADVLVLPNTALEERSQKYTTPIKLFEYLASGVPIVASDIPSFHIFLNNNVNTLFFKPDDPKDLTKKIDIILQNPQIAKEISNKAKVDAAKYTWGKRAASVLEFLKN